MDWGALLTTIGVGVSAFIGAWFVFRGKKVDKQIKEVEVEASAEVAFLNGQVTFQKYVDETVERQVKAATAEVQRRLTEVELRLESVQQESHEMNDAVRSRETQLWLWNIRGRAGEMPGLPEPILVRLGIIHLAERPPIIQGEAP